MSLAYSATITGSAEVKAALLQPSSSAGGAIASGEAWSASRSMSRDLEMSQFWQNLQARLQPAVPKERMLDPGKNWLSGFFSTGSIQKPDERPYVVSTMRSRSRMRTKHAP